MSYHLCRTPGSNPLIRTTAPAIGTRWTCPDGDCGRVWVFVGTIGRELLWERPGLSERIRTYNPLRLRKSLLQPILAVLICLVITFAIVVYTSVFAGDWAIVVSLAVVCFSYWLATTIQETIISTLLARKVPRP